MIGCGTATVRLMSLVETPAPNYSWVQETAKSFRPVKGEVSSLSASIEIGHSCPSSAGNMKPDTHSVAALPAG